MKLFKLSNSRIAFDPSVDIIKDSVIDNVRTVEVITKSNNTLIFTGKDAEIMLEHFKNFNFFS